MCEWCPANRTDKNWMDFGPDSAWMKLQYTLQDYMNLDHNQLILTLPGVNIFTAMQDILHIVCKGTGPRILGTALFTFIQNEPTVEGTLSERLDLIWFLLVAEYDRLGVPSRCRISQLTISMLCESEARNPTAYPDLRQVKAAQVRYLVQPVLALCARFNRRTAECEHRERCVACLGRFYAAIATQEHYLTPDESNEVLASVHECCLHYVALARMATARGRNLWLVTPKFHYWFHLAVFARFANPRTSWTYADEDYVGRLAKVAKSMVFGIGALRVAGGVVRKFRTALGVRFRRRAVVSSW